jgi:hypothetical protein
MGGRDDGTPVAGLRGSPRSMLLRSTPDGFGGGAPAIVFDGADFQHRQRATSTGLGCPLEGKGQSWVRWYHGQPLQSASWLLQPFQRLSARFNQALPGIVLDKKDRPIASFVWPRNSAEVTAAE